MPATPRFCTVKGFGCIACKRVLSAARICTEIDAPPTALGFAQSRPLPPLPPPPTPPHPAEEEDEEPEYQDDSDDSEEDEDDVVGGGCR